MFNNFKCYRTEVLISLLENIPDDTVTHIQNGHYTRIEGDKYRVYQTKRPCINGEGHDCEYWGCDVAMWSRYTNGFASSAGVSILEFERELKRRQKPRVRLYAILGTKEI